MTAKKELDFAKRVVNTFKKHNSIASTAIEMQVMRAQVERCLELAKFDVEAHFEHVRAILREETSPRLKSKKLGITTARLRLLHKRLNVPLYSATKKGEVQDDVIALYTAGQKIADILKQTGISKKLMYQILDEQNVPRRQ